MSVSSERKAPIPVPRGGFSSDEKEAQWLADTIAMRSAEAVAALGITATFPTDSLYKLLLIGLQSAAKRATGDLVERRREAEARLKVARDALIAAQEDFGDLGVDGPTEAIGLALAALDRQGGSPDA